MRRYQRFSLVLLGLSTILLRGQPTGAGAEVIHGFHITPQEIIVFVTSHGCTGKDHFRLDIAESRPLQVTVRRVREDLCRAFSREAEIRFSKSELGIREGETVVVTNPFDTGGLPSL